MAGAAALVPVGGAQATTCAPTPAVAGVDVNVCYDLLPEPGGYSTSASVSVYVNGGRTAYCVARIHVGTGGVDIASAPVYNC